MQGYRRSLSDWLVICNKTHATWSTLVASGLGKKQALIHGLPLDAHHIVERDMLVRCNGNPHPEHLPQRMLRQERIEAWLAKYSEMDDLERRFWAKALLHNCYPVWRLGEAWRPKIQDFFPWTEALSPTIEEKGIFRAISRCPLLTGDLLAGYWPTPTLENYFAPRVKTKGIGLHSWRARFSQLPPGTYSIVDVAKCIGTHRAVIYLSFRRKGIPLSGRKPREDWVALAIRADATDTAKRAMMRNRTRGNVRRYL